MLYVARVIGSRFDVCPDVRGGAWQRARCHFRRDRESGSSIVNASTTVARVVRKWIVRNHFVISCFAFASRIRFVRLDKSSWGNVRRSVTTTVVGNYTRLDSALRREICQVDTFLWEFSTRHCRCNCEWNSVCYNHPSARAESRFLVFIRVTKIHCIPRLTSIHIYLSFVRLHQTY